MITNYESLTIYAFNDLYFYKVIGDFQSRRHLNKLFTSFRIILSRWVESVQHDNIYITMLYEIWLSFASLTSSLYVTVAVGNVACIFYGNR